jgi:hypothetical protein
MLQAWPTHHVEMGGLPDTDPLVRGSDPDPLSGGSDPDPAPDPYLFLKK